MSICLPVRRCLTRDIIPTVTQLGRRHAESEWAMHPLKLVGRGKLQMQSCDVTRVDVRSHMY